MDRIDTDVDYQNIDEDRNEGTCAENVLKTNASYDQSLQLTDSGHYGQIYGMEQSEDIIYRVPKTSRSVQKTNVSEEKEKSALK